MLKIKNWILILIVAYSSFALACSCMRYTLEDAVAENDAILIVDVYKIEVLKKGGVNEESNKPYPEEGLRRGHFKVVKTLKGVYHGPSYLETVDHAVCCMCQTVVKEGRYLLYSDDGGAVNISSCSPDHMLSKGDEHLVEVIEKLAQLSPKEILSGYIKNGKEKQFYATTKSAPENLNNVPYTINQHRIGYYTIEGFRLSDGSFWITKLISEETYSSEAQENLIEEIVRESHPVDKKQKENE